MTFPGTDYLMAFITFLSCRNSYLCLAQRNSAGFPPYERIKTPQ